MGIAKLRAAGLDGIAAYAVEVEADVTSGLPNVIVVGLPDLAVRESRDRVKSALKNSGLAFPIGRVTVNLAPARRKKDGAAFDLPIALGILAAAGHIPPERLRGTAALGELSLGGRTRPVRGALAAAEALAASGTRRLVIARESAAEAALARGHLAVYPVETLVEAVAVVRGEHSVDPVRADLDALVDAARASTSEALDLDEIEGNAAAKRALLVAAAGGHDLLLVGPPGTGKTMLARRLPGILPPLTLDEILEITRVHSSVGAVPRGGVLTSRPFRAPHHTVSYVGLVGGGSHGARPGEVSLAHHGVLFLDELPELATQALEALREPLETRKISISRAWGSTELPADFQLVAAMNPCPCGYLNDPRRECRCREADRTRYASKLSGPLLDRIDLQVPVLAVEAGRLLGPSPGTGADPVGRLSSQEAQSLATGVRDRARDRGCVSNARLTPRELDRVAPLDAEARALLLEAARRLALSARGIIKVRRIARTIADLAGRDALTGEDVAEALALRRVEEFAAVAPAGAPGEQVGGAVTAPAGWSSR